MRVYGDGSPRVINKDHRRLQKVYTGTEENQGERLGRATCFIVESSKQTQGKNWGGVGGGEPEEPVDAILPVTIKTGMQ